MFNIFKRKKKQEPNPKELYARERYDEIINLHCKCGVLLISDDMECMMMGYDIGDCYSLETYKDNLSHFCKSCNKEIKYDGLAESSQSIFERTVKFDLNDRADFDKNK